MSLGLVRKTKAPKVVPNMNLTQGTGYVDFGRAKTEGSGQK